MRLFKIDKIKNRALKMHDFITDILFPIECLHCGQGKEWLCRDCFNKINYNDIQYCLDCKKTNENGKFCNSCKDKYFLDGIIIVGDYSNVILKKLIKTFKYGFIKDLSFILGKYLALFFLKIENKKLSSNLENCNYIIPVPLHAKRIRWRGFNQSAELINKIVMFAKLYKIKCFEKKIYCNDLKRVVNKKPQTKLNRENRELNIKDCYIWTGNNLKLENIIIVDDVTTTGATLNECAKVLKQNGAGKVWGLVIANG